MVTPFFFNTWGMGMSMREHPRVRLAALAIASLACACIGGASPQTLGAQGATRAATPRVVRGAISLEIGGARETRPAARFSDIRGISADRSGRIFVVDGTNHNVRAFSPAGAPLFSFGSKGKGAGQLSDPCCSSFGPDGNLWVQDFGNRRYNAYAIGANAGRFVRSIRGSENGIGFNNGLTFDGNGRLYDFTSTFDVKTKSFRIMRRLLDGSGTALDVDTIPDPRADSLARATISHGASAAVFNQPFGAVSLRAYGPQGDMALAVSSNYAVLWADASGKPLTLLKGSAAGPPLAESERARADRTLAAIALQSGLAVSALPFGVPARKQPLEHLGFDGEDNLWVQRSMPLGAPSEADVFDRSGQRVAVMQWPGDVRLNISSVRNGVGYGVRNDGAGVLSVVRIAFKN